jgi:hypothetical protein
VPNRTSSRGAATRRALAVVLLGVALAPGAAAKTGTSMKKGTLVPTLIAEAVRVAATPIATSTGVTLGRPACPSGASSKPGTVIQCVVGFGPVPVGFLVTVAPSGVLSAAPTFPIHRRSAVEAAASVRERTTVRCGTAPVIVLPAGALLTCRAGSRDVAFQVAADGSLQAPDAAGAPGASTTTGARAPSGG